MRLATVVKVTLRKVRSTWYWTAHYPEGGSFGSNHCGSKKVALHKAAVGVLPGETFELVTNEKSEGWFTRSLSGALVPA